jgi:hypothetical protein
MPKKYAHINFAPPKDVQAAARRGLALRRKFGRGGLSRKEASAQGIGSGVQRATNLANGDKVSPETIGRMVSFFARHEKNKDSKTPSGEPGAGQISWLLWGGTPGQRWATKVKRQMEAADMKNKSLATLAQQVLIVRSKMENKPQNGGFISPPIAPFFPYVEPTRPLPLTYKSGQHTSAMIALFLPATYARKYALSDPGALDPSEMHITLAYLGKADQIPGPAVNSIHEFMELVSEHHPPLTGTINGCGRFCNGDDDGDPFFIIPDLPDLPNLRELIVLWLRGNDVPVGQDHGFTPHTDPNPFDQLERAPVSFPTISLVLAGDRYDYPLNGGIRQT